jgi:tetratricopeptide (TPR) repeat protein
MPESARAPLQPIQTIALIESSPLSSASWEALADKVRGENDPLSAQSLEVIIQGLKRVEEIYEGADQGPLQRLSGLSQSMFVRLARAYNSPTLLKEVGLVYLRDLNLPEVALHHFERSLLLGGPEKELRPLTEAAAVAVQRQIARQKGEAPSLSGLSSARPLNPVATTIIRRTGKMLLPARFGQTATLPGPVADEVDDEKPLPKTTAECVAEAETAVQKGALRRAEALLQKANDEPGEGHAMWQAWTDLGQAEYERGNYPKVEAAFSQALKYEPNELASHFNAALGYHLNQKFAEAAAAYVRADELQGRHPKVWCNLGVLHFQMDAYAEAEKALRRATEADPTYARAWDNLAASLGAQDKLDEAMEACRRALELRPAYPEAHFKLGIIYFSKSEWEKAVEEFSRAGALPAITGYCEVFLAMIYARLQQTEAAEAAARRAVQIDPKCDLLWMAWNDLGLAWFSARDYGRAAAAYGEATLLKPDEPVAWLNLGVIYHRSGDLKAARDSYQHAVDLDESLAEGWHNLGTICAETGDLSAAVAAFRRETQCAPGNVRAWHDLGVAYEKSGQREAARDAFARTEMLGASGPAAEGAPSA